MYNYLLKQHSNKYGRSVGRLVCQSVSQLGNVLLKQGNTNFWSHWPVRFVNTQILLQQLPLQPQPPQPAAAHPAVPRYRRCHWARLCCFLGLCWQTLPLLYFPGIPLASVWHQSHQTTPLRLLLHFQNFKQWERIMLLHSREVRTGVRSILKGDYHRDFHAFLVKTVFKAWVNTFAQTSNTPRTPIVKYFLDRVEQNIVICQWGGSQPMIRMIILVEGRANCN